MNLALPLMKRSLSMLQPALAAAQAAVQAAALAADPAPDELVPAPVALEWLLGELMRLVAHRMLGCIRLKIHKLAVMQQIGKGDNSTCCSLRSRTETYGSIGKISPCEQGQFFWG